MVKSSNTICALIIIVITYDVYPAKQTVHKKPERFANLDVAGNL
jgi:hypothetical protein